MRLQAGMTNFALRLSGICMLSLLIACGGSGTPPVVAPTVTISASPNTVTLPNSFVLTWSSTNATSCTASANPSSSDWAGAVTTSGSQSVTPAAAGTTTYSLQCTGKGGNASKSAAVTANIGALAITSSIPPDGVVGTLYNKHSVVCQRGSPGCH